MRKDLNAGDDVQRYYIGSSIYEGVPWDHNSFEIVEARFSKGVFLLGTTPIGPNFVPHYFVKDHLGNVRAVLNANMQVLEWNDYTPFGKRWSNPIAPISANRYRYAGKEEVVISGANRSEQQQLYNFGVRFYNPRSGRWLSIDPLARSTRM